MASERDELADSFGARLRRLREGAGLSQEELAEEAGLTAQAVGALERGIRHRPYPETVRRLADALALTDDARAALFAAVPRRGARSSKADEGDAARLFVETPQRWRRSAGGWTVCP